jgi:hypothetical protein
MQFKMETFEDGLPHSTASLTRVNYNYASNMITRL